MKQILKGAKALIIALVAGNHLYIKFVQNILPRGKIFLRFLSLRLLVFIHRKTLVSRGFALLCL